MSGRVALVVVLLMTLARAGAAQPLPPAPTLVGRPLGMRDLAPTRSVGVLSEGAILIGEEEPLFPLGIQLDADVALGRHLKVFGAFPIVAAHGWGSAVVGLGNLEAGLLAMSGGSRLRLGASGAAGYGATVDGWVGELLHFDRAAFVRGRPVLRGALLARVDHGADRFVQLQAEHAHFRESERPGARLGAGLRWGSLWFLGELHASHELVRDAEDATVAGLDLGVRGRFPGRGGQSWCGRAGVAYTEGLLSLGAGIEIRTW